MTFLRNDRRLARAIIGWVEPLFFEPALPTIDEASTGVRRLFRTLLAAEAA